MMHLLPLLLLSASSYALPGAPLARRAETVTVTLTADALKPSSTAWNAGAVTQYPIHSSCNSTERAQLQRGLEEAIALAQHAKDHILRWGNSSELYQKYFGNASTAEPSGWFDKVVNADKAGMVFRCDNPDGNCEQEGWAGHWRGENATSETVICPLSYEVRRPLEAMCGLGYTVANSKTNFYWASDLLHRLYHIPGIGEDVIGHHADEYTGCLELAKEHPELAVRNSDSLQYFALDAYAFDIAVPGEGCAGKPSASASATEASTVASSTGAPISSVSETPSATSAAVSSIAQAPTTSETPSVTSSAPKECHTHDDGVVHCD